MRDMRPSVVDTEIRAGERIEIGRRSIYPVIKVSVLRTPDGAVLGSWIAPLAMLVIEPEMQYAISFTGEEITADQIGTMVPSLKKAIDKARGIYRIEVS
jgi:uncharacterized spore protein YtfJ